MLKNKKKKIYLAVLVLIIVVGGFFRFYRYSERVTFDADSGRDAFVAIEGARSIQMPLTGPFISIAPVTTGPWYWYQLILFRFTVRSIYSPWIYLGILSMLMILIMYRIGVLLESKLFGLILAAITALSPQQISTAYWLTNPSIIGVFSALTICLFLEIVLRKRKPVFGLFFGLTAGIAVTSHYQSLPLFLLILYLLFYKKYRAFAYSIAGVLITTIPLVLFELNNHWFNVRNMLDYLRFGQYRIWTSVRWLTFIGDFWPRFWAFAVGGTKNLGLFLMIFSGIAIAFKILFSPIRKTYLLLFINYFIAVIIIRYYRGERFFGYLQYFHPYLFILTGLVLYSLWKNKFKRWLGPLGIVVYCLLVVPSTIATIGPYGVTKYTKDIYSRIISEWGDKKYSFYDCEGTNINNSRSVALMLDLHGKLDPKSKNKLIYLYGDCQLPKLSSNPDDITFSSIDVIYDVSTATKAAVLESKGKPLTSTREYQSSARWWFEEQP